MSAPIIPPAWSLAHLPPPTPDLPGWPDGWKMYHPSCVWIIRAAGDDMVIGYLVKDDA